MADIIHVAAAAIINANNEVLISRRADDAHQGGLWEFPGGKLETDETVESALKRELTEELAIEADSYRPLIKITHHYPDKSVLLDVWKVEKYSGKPHGKEGQAIRWLPVNQLQAREFPAADVPIIRALNLPEHYMISGQFSTLEEFEQRFSAALERGIRLAQLRLSRDWLQAGNEKLAREAVTAAVRLCEFSGAKLLFNLPDELLAGVEPSSLHLNSRQLKSLVRRPDCELLCASCHDLDEINRALELEADFIVLSPVQKTASHPDAEPLGWKKFSAMVSQINVPVYALGGVSRKDTEKAWYAGAQGVAAIGAFWNQ